MEVLDKLGIKATYVPLLNDTPPSSARRMASQKRWRTAT